MDVDHGDEDTVIRWRFGGMLVVSAAAPTRLQTASVSRRACELVLWCRRGRL